MKRPATRSSVLATFVGALALLALPACNPEVPAAPSYKNDVQPILAAHCVRCHGANDTLNAADPAATNIMTPTPSICYFQRYDDGGDCSVASTCKHGAHYCANMIPLYITLPDDSNKRMPPLPSDRLNDWELEVLKRWAANPAP